MAMCVCRIRQSGKDRGGGIIGWRARDRNAAIVCSQAREREIALSCAATDRARDREGEFGKRGERER